MDIITAQIDVLQFKMRNEGGFLMYHYLNISISLLAFQPYSVYNLMNDILNNKISFMINKTS